MARWRDDRGTSTPDRRAWSATIRRDGSDWEVSVPELGVTARVALLAQAHEVARDLVRRHAPDVAADTRPRVAVRPLVPPRVRALLASADRMRAASDSLRVDDVVARRQLARGFLDEGLDVADVAALLGVSEARVRLLAAGSHTAPPTPAAPPASLAIPAALPTAAALPRPVTLPTARTGRPGGAGRAGAPRSHRHEALLHRGDTDFLAQAVPFLLEGVALGQSVLAAVPGPRLGALQEALGADADRVQFVDMTELGRNPARIIPAWLEFLDEYGGRVPVRGLGEPVWAGRDPAGVAEYQLHEALLNVAVAPDVPAWLRCAYDVDVVEPDVLDSALCSHPLVVEGAEPQGSTRYGGLAYVEELLGAPLPEPAGPPTEAAFGAQDLAVVRALATRWCRAAGLSRDRAADVVLAVTELATNSVRHGGGRGCLRTWRQDGWLVVEVADAGHVTDPLAGRRAPGWEQEGGRGLWLVNQLCDLVQLRSGPDGTVVRVLERTPA